MASCAAKTRNSIVCALRFLYGVTLGQDTVPELILCAREPSGYRWIEY
jgi:hypothetical protein